MKRLLLLGGIAVGACAIAVPAAAGLSGNPSFSEHVPVRVPNSATVVTFDDHGGAARTSGVAGPASTTPTRPRHSEPGDDHHRNRHGSTSTTSTTRSSTSMSRSTEPGDDRGGASGGGRRHGFDDTTTGHDGRHGDD